MAFGQQTRQLINPGSQSNVVGQAGIASLNRLAQEQMQIRQLEAMKERQDQQIAAQASMQKQASDHAFKMTAMKAGLGEQIQQKTFEQQLQMSQQEAVQRARQFDYEFTTENKFKIAREEQAHEKFMRDPNHTPEQKMTYDLAYQANQMGINRQPSAVPHKPTVEDGLPEGAKIGVPYTDPQTGIMGTYGVRNGTVQFTESKIQQEKIKSEQKMQEKQLDAQMKEKELYFKSLQEAQKSAAEKAEGLSDSPGGFFSRPSTAKTDAINQELQRFNDSWRSVYGSVPGEQQQPKPQPQAQPQQRPQPQEEMGVLGRPVRSDWYSQLEAGGKQIPDEWKRLPAVTGEAVFVLKSIESKYGDSVAKMPKEVQMLYLRSVAEIENAKNHGLLQ